MGLQPDPRNMGPDPAYPNGGGGGRPAMTHAAESSGARDAVSEREEPAEPWTAKLGVALVVALVTGVITIGGAIGGQWVAKNWQSREHEHELKSQLATEMSDAFTAPLLTA